MSVVLREYIHTPPEPFRKVVLKHLEKMDGVYCPMFDGKKLVAAHSPLAHTRTHTTVEALLIGLEDGYKAAMGPTKPYGLKYDNIKFPKMNGEPFIDGEKTEWFVTREEAHQRRMFLNEDMRNRLEVIRKSRPHLHDNIARLGERFRPQIIHSEDREHHF